MIVGIAAATLMTIATLAVFEPGLITLTIAEPESISPEEVGYIAKLLKKVATGTALSSNPRHL